MGTVKKPKKVLKELVPVNDIFNEEEAILYNDLVDVYLNDFEKDELTASDIDDILDLAKNRIFEFRLLRESKNSVAKQIDTSSTLEKIKKENKTLKENLFTRRKDRINPNEFKGFSIVDLAVAFDEKKKRHLSEKIRKNKEEEHSIIEQRHGYSGNRYDIETNSTQEDKDNG